jgi:hypothetical protein
MFESPSCVDLHKFLNLFKFWFAHLQNGYNNNDFFLSFFFFCSTGA